MFHNCVTGVSGCIEGIEVAMVYDVCEGQNGEVMNCFMHERCMTHVLYMYVTTLVPVFY